METLILYLECIVASVAGLAFHNFTKMDGLNKKNAEVGKVFDVKSYISAEKFAIMANLCAQVLAILFMRSAIQEYPNIHELWFVAGNSVIGFGGSYIASKFFGGAIKKYDKFVEEKTK